MPGPCSPSVGRWNWEACSSLLTIAGEFQAGERHSKAIALGHGHLRWSYDLHVHSHTCAYSLTHTRVDRHTQIVSIDVAMIIKKSYIIFELVLLNIVASLNFVFVFWVCFGFGSGVGVEFL